MKRTTAVDNWHNNVEKLVYAIEKHCNPFKQEGLTVCNIVTRVVILEEALTHIINMGCIGQKFYENFVKECFHSDLSLWSPVKKQKLKFYTYTNKQQVVKLREQVTELKETKSLFARMMIIAKLNRNVDYSLTIGMYEFTVISRSLFAADGSL